MKKILLVALFLASQTIFANSNPQMRTCRINLGQFWTVNIENPKTDNIGFCRFGNEMVDSITFMNYAFTNTPSNSLEAFLATEDFNFYSCAGAGAQKHPAGRAYSRDGGLCPSSNDGGAQPPPPFGSASHLRCHSRGWRGGGRFHRARRRCRHSCSTRPMP